jgi:hypothetical protein
MAPFGTYAALCMDSEADAETYVLNECRSVLLMECGIALETAGTIIGSISVDYVNECWGAGEAQNVPDAIKAAVLACQDMNPACTQCQPSNITQAC